MKIIFVLLDDLGWNDVENHNPQISTPNLLEFSKDACELNQNYTFSVCGPTRAMIQTGIYSFSYGFQTLFPPDCNYGLDESLKITPSYLKEMNFSNYAIGKWHLGHNQLKWHPYKRGYDYHYGNLTGCIDHLSHTNCPTGMYDFSENGKRINDVGHSCDLLTNKTIKIIENNKNNNFFIYLAYNSPHVPLQCPKKFVDIYKNIKEPRKSFLGMVSHLDFNLGRIFEKLKSLNIYDETLIWIQSDNGGWTPDWAGGNNSPLRGGKASFYQGGVRAFTLVKYKDIKTKSYNGISHSVDFLPTMLDFCGYKNENNFDGISLKESLVNNTITKRDLVLSYYNENIWCFILDCGLKIINENSKMECYDIFNDPFEKNNIKIPDKENEKIKNIIKICAERRRLEPSVKHLKINKSRIKFWGDLKNNNNIKILNSDKKIKINKKSTFLSLSGYDIFYK